MKRISVIAYIFLIASVLAGAEGYDLKNYLARVGQYSRDLQLARKDTDLSEQAVRQATSALFPSVYAQAGYNRNMKDVMKSYPTSVTISGAGPTYPLSWSEIDGNLNNEFTAGVSVQQNLFNMKAYSALKYGREYADLTRVLYDEKDRSVLTAAKKIYYQAVLLREVLKVKEASEQNDRDNYYWMKNRYETGVAQELEMLRAEVTWKTRTAETSQARKNLEVALVNFRTLAGIDPEAQITLTDSLESFPEFPKALAPEQVYSGRSDYSLLLKQKRLAEISEDLAMADFYPTVSASLGYGWFTTSDDYKFENKVETLTLGLKVSMPVYTGGARIAQLESGKTVTEKRGIELKKKEDDIRAELKQLHLSLREARDRIDSADKVLATAEKAYGLAKTSRDNGLITQLELNESSVQLEQARLLRLSSVFEYLVTYFDWEKAVGR